MSDSKQTPPGAPSSIWIVIAPTGERHVIDKEMDVVAWAQGTNVTVLEYRFSGIAYAPPAAVATGR